jgi:hypothetical protein
VWTLVVVFFLAPSSEPPRLGQIGEPLAIQKLVPQTAKERFCKTIFPGAPGSM